MPRLELTKKNIDKLSFTEKNKAVDYWDISLKGFGLRVGEQTKTFFVKADVKTAQSDNASRPYKTVKSIIGRYGEWTPELARKEAGERLRSLKAGKVAQKGSPVTLRELYNRYLLDKGLKENTIASYRIYFENEGGAKFTTWMDIPVSSLEQLLTPDIVIKRFQEVLNNSGKAAAYNSFKKLQAIISYGMILYPQLINRNPVKVLSDARLWPEIKARTTCLEPEQFKVFYDALLMFSAMQRDCYLFALYQGLRPDEAHSLRWADVNLEKRLFDLTWMDSTTKHRGVLPLSKQTMEILNRRKEAKQDEDEFVFPSTFSRNKKGHVILRADRLRKNTNLDITPHSLRRSFTTVGERLKLRREDINLLTNHVDQSVTGRHYVRLAVEDLRAPLQAICNEIERLMIEGPGAKVIVLPTASHYIE